MQIYATRKKPADYMEVQRNINTFHKDGMKWHSEERVREKVQIMIQLLQRNRIRVKTALFVGCRMGCEMIEFQQAYPLVEVMGCDIVPEFVEETKKRAGNAVIADAHDLPFKDNEYDVVFSSQTLEHCYDPELAVSEIMRVAKDVVHLSLPLENKYKYDQNPSHFAYVKNPIGWIRLMEPYETWRLDWAGITEHNCFDIFMRHMGVDYEQQ